MAEVSSSYLNLLDPDSGLEPVDDPHQTLSQGSISYWSHHHFDHIYSSDPQFPPPSDNYSPRESTIRIRDLVEEEDEDVLDIDSIRNTADLFGHRENQVNFVMDLFHQRVEQSQVMGEQLQDSDFRVVEGELDVGIDGLDLDLGLGLGFGFEVEKHESRGFTSRNCGFAADDDDEDEDGDDDDDFFVGRRVSRSQFGEVRSMVSTVEPFENCVRVVGFGSDSDEDENDLVLGIDLHSENDDCCYGELDCIHEVEVEGDRDNDISMSIPNLCWDSLQLEDHREANEDFEWEEVDGRVDEREVLSMFIDDAVEEDERSVSVSISPAVGDIEEVGGVRVGGLEGLEWEVLLSANNLETNMGLDSDAEPYFGDHEDYIYTADAEYEMLFGQFADYDIMGKPPASKSVVRNLPSLVMTQEDVEKKNSLCAVCKDDIGVGEKAKHLPCAHRYHGECIVPWLGIRNTCPVCRYELPTDDAEYERRRAQRAGRGA